MKRRTEAKARIITKRPDPLPCPRSLLFPSPTQPSSCLFFRLPAELRIRIYHLVYSNHIFHLSLVSNYIVHDQLDNSEDIDDQVGSVPIVMPPHRGFVEDHGVQGQTLLALSQTCRILYNETVPLVYATNIFSLNSPLALLYLCDYILPPQRIPGIRHLRLFWKHSCTSSDEHAWERLWTLVAEMKLESLAIWLFHIGKEENVDVEREWIKPLFKVKGVQKIGFRVETSPGSGSRRVEEVEREIARRLTL